MATAVAKTTDPYDPRSPREVVNRVVKKCVLAGSKTTCESGCFGERLLTDGARDWEAALRDRPGAPVERAAPLHLQGGARARPP